MKTKEGARFKRAIVLNAKESYKYLVNRRELVGQLITQGAKKHSSGKCPLDLAMTGNFYQIISGGGDGVWLSGI